MIQTRMYGQGGEYTVSRWELFYLTQIWLINYNYRLKNDQTHGHEILVKIWFLALSALTIIW